MSTLATELTADLCRATPTVQVLDNRGLVVRNLQYNRRTAGEVAQSLRTQQHYNARGVLLSSLDPRLGAAQQIDPALAPNFRYQASLSARVLRTQGVDAGQQVTLFDIEGGPLWQQGSRGQFLRWSYDRLHRISALAEQASSTSPERLSEQYQYGEGRADAVAANARGQLVAHYDPAGLNQIPCYNRSAQPLLTVRQLLTDPQAEGDWQGDEADWHMQLEATRYASRQRYNALGAAIGSVDAKGHQQQQRLNIAGQLAGSALILADGSHRALLTAIRYSAAGQVHQETAGNGVVSDYHYEAPTQRLSRLSTTRPASSGRSTLLQDLSYRYDPVGNILAIDDAAQVVRYHKNQRIVAANNYQYDALYQLTQATGRENTGAAPQGPALPPPQVPLSVDPNAFSPYNRTYQYDDGGNLVQIRHQGAQSYTTKLLVSPTSNRAVQQTGFLLPSDVEGYFDAGGNVLQLTAGQPLAWDERNQLQRVAQVVRSDSAVDAESYQYDGGGQRLRKTRVSHTSSTQRTAQVLYLPGLELRLIQSEHNGTLSTVEALQVIQAGAAGRQSMRLLHWEVGRPADMPNDQLRGSLDNQIGSSLLELDQQAEILTLEEYFPFGGTAVWSGRTLSETQYKFVRYSGKERDATGLYYYGFRYYAPWLARWLNPDPAGTIDGLNLFGMVKNNPVNFNDPDGLMLRRGKGAPNRPIPINQSVRITRSGPAANETLPPLVDSSVTAQGVASQPLTLPPLAHQQTNRLPKKLSASTSLAALPTVADAHASRGISASYAHLNFPPILPNSSITMKATTNYEYHDPHLEKRLNLYKAANAERFEAVNEMEHSQGRFQATSYGVKKSSFVNRYKPDSWEFLMIFRYPEERFFAADVIVEQYTRIARTNNFFGSLPMEVSHTSISNTAVLNLIKTANDSSFDADGFFEDFMNKTDNGKFTKRTLNVFGMEAYAIKERPKGKDLTLLVRKMRNN
jgi:insecticidal toxin complex protein TccC